MSRYSDQLGFLVTTLEAITDIGRVHNRPRYGDAHEHWTTKLNGEDTIRAWEVGLEDPGTTNESTSQHFLHERRHWIIRGYLSLIDKDPLTGELSDSAASYHVINELGLAIASAINADPTMGGTALDHNEVQVTDPAVITIGGGFLCWGISLSVQATALIPR